MNELVHIREIILFVCLSDSNRFQDVIKTRMKYVDQFLLPKGVIKNLFDGTIYLVYELFLRLELEKKRNVLARSAAPPPHRSPVERNEEFGWIRLTIPSSLHLLEHFRTYEQLSVE